MKNKIYYLARSYSPYQKGGGPLMRTGAVRYLEELGWDVTVVLPNYTTSQLILEKNTIQIPFRYRYIQKITSLLERVGIYEDYLDEWLDEAFKYLKDKIKQEDIIFATSGGELGMIKLGSLLQKERKCKFVINFRDPLNYGYMNGLRRDKKFHIGREKAHAKYMKDADLILTSSQYYADVLSHHFTYLSDKIVNNYFGYIQKLEIENYHKQTSSKFKIAYVGTMGKTQKPELLYEAWKLLNDNSIEIYFIGDTQNYKPLNSIKEEGVHLIDFMPHDKFLKFMCKNIDAGFVSLTSDYFGACVPSKIYEYINLGLPMIGALPKGDGIDIINNKGYGMACKYDDISMLVNNIKKLKDKNLLTKISKKILEDKDSWSMKNTILEVDKLLKELT
jgi:glycosyltransferase involved in cell wall biosynthesis